MATVITSANISELLSSSKVVVIDFWATWCGPCRMLGPVVEELAAELEGKVVVGKCNVDDEEDIATQYGIRNIPTLLFFKDGQLADRTVGVVSKKEILDRIAKLA